MRRIFAVGVAAATLFGFASVPAWSATGTDQVIDYHGYQIQVPASWPVYNLATDPTRCVLFNEHAVYLGTPGADQRCPVHEFGRTEAVLVQPEQTSLPPGALTLASDTASLPGALPASATNSHTVQFAAPGPGVTVTATYGADDTQIRSILAGARMTAKSPATNAPATSAPAAARPSAGSGGSTAPQVSLRQGQGLGIDPCTVPSVATMTDWLASPYRVIGTYLGGVNWACGYGNFDRAWASEVAAEGWQYIPIWVGPQAPCTTIKNATLIDPADAAAQGSAEAASAVATAQSFGYGRGTPIYFDMEGYSRSNTSCGQAVTTFLGGWTEGLHAAGYLSGVYSSASSGIADLAALYANPDYQRPDDVWVARWSGDPVLTDPDIPSGDWPNAVSHQYYGGHDETWGGSTVNVDSDVVDSAVAGYPVPSNTGGVAMFDEPSAVSVAPGNTGTAQLVINGGQHDSFVSWRADAPAGVSVTPGSGHLFVPANGQASVPVQVSASASLPAGRYDVPITAYAGFQQLTETFLLVSSGSAVPGAVVLYAADPQSMTIAAADGQRLALPPSGVTGNFETAWNDASGNSDVVIAVGAAASDALFYNACGWTNPAGTGAGSTPFGYPVAPLRSGHAGTFEGAVGTSTATTTLLADQFAQYALAGTIPNDGGQPVGPATPTDTCLGSANIPVQ
ncbi:MAG TPA: DUF1906 domain-containing protein [Pseudonocardiaceae bacterium]|nr:DUF1906 domain-containing protein [Pseudonocardiaceae bacterium]